MTELFYGSAMNDLISCLNSNEEIDKELSNTPPNKLIYWLRTMITFLWAHDTLTLSCNSASNAKTTLQTNRSEPSLSQSSDLTLRLPRPKLRLEFHPHLDHSHYSPPLETTTFIHASLVTVLYMSPACSLSFSNKHHVSDSVWWSSGMILA